MSAARNDIRDRIDLALEKKGTAHPCRYNDCIVRSGKRSIVYSKHGVGFVIPKRISHRVSA